MITVEKKKHFRFQMPPKDNELWAVGAVAVHWSQLETLLHFFMQVLLGKDSDEFKVFASAGAMEKRLELIKIAVERHVMDPERGIIIGLIDKTKNAKYMRDRIMHDTWAGSPKSDQDVGKVSVFNWIKPREPLDWNLDFGSIVRVAQLIDQILIELTVNVGLGPPKPGSPNLMSDALQRIRRKPDQT